MDHRVQLHITWGRHATPETRDLSDFHGGPFKWHDSPQLITDSLGIIRFGYLYPIPSGEADAFVEQLNHFHALWLLSQGASSNSAV